MHEQARNQRREPARRATRKGDEHALRNIVSLRISDQERLVLEEIAANTTRNVSEVVREAIDFWLARRRRFCLGG